MTSYQLEVAARNICQARGLNPDELVPHSPEPVNGYVNTVLMHSPRWTLAVREIREHHLRHTAIQFALGLNTSDGAQ